jgi:hypothetical protein
MKNLNLTLLAVLILPTISFASPPQLSMVATVSVNGAPDEVFSSKIKPGSTRVFDLSNGMKLELATRVISSDEEEANFRLLRSEGGSTQYQVVHESSVKPAANKDVQVAYVVCNKGVRFLSPAPAQLPKCE